MQQHTPSIPIHDDSHPLRSYTLDPAFRHIHTLATCSLHPPPLHTHTTTTIPTALLIAPSGTGKTSFSRLLSSHLHLRLTPITRPLTPSGLSSAFAALTTAPPHPSLLLLDDAHLLFPAHSADPAHHHRLLSTFLSLLATLLASSPSPSPPSTYPSPSGLSQQPRVLVLATTTPDEVERVHPHLRAALHHHFTATLPSSTHRLHILHSLTSPHPPPSTPHTPPAWLAAVNDRCQGMTGGDLVALTRLATLHASLAHRTSPTAPDFTSALHSLSPSPPTSSSSPTVQRLDGPHTAVRMSDIIGLDDAKRQLLDAVQPLLLSSPIALARPLSSLARALRPPPGLLLYGGPGTGKAMLAQAMAAVPGLSFYSLSMPSLLHCHVGASERALHSAFSLALTSAPSILFIPHLDALFPASSSSTPSSHPGPASSPSPSADPTSTRLTSTLCSLLSSIAAHRLPLLLLATSNRPQAIDPALLQPHRMGMLEVRGVGEKERVQVVRRMMDEAGLGWEGEEEGRGEGEGSGEGEGGVRQAVRRWMEGLTVADVRFVMAAVLRGKARGEGVCEVEVKEARGRMAPSGGEDVEWELWRWTQRQRRRRLQPDADGD